MAKHPAEVFGYPIDVNSTPAQDSRRRYWCPFVDKQCEKESRLLAYPMGVCSVQYGQEVIALSPRRLLEDNTVFHDIADHYFGSRSNLLVFDEVSVPSARYLGRFDYVMVKHEPLSSRIEDFIAIEHQTAQTTSTGHLVQALKDFMGGKDVKGANYGFGLNLADIWKRAFTQILTKGIALEHWGHKIYWVVQEPVFQDFLARYKLGTMTYHPSHTTVFAIYNLRRAGDRYELFHTAIVSSTVDDMFHAFRTNFEVPPKDAFIKKLQMRAKANMQLRLELES